MNFAPYQSSPPESTRALSPPPRSSTTSPTPRRLPFRASSDLHRPAPKATSAATEPAPAVQPTHLLPSADPWAVPRPLPSPSQFVDRGYQDIDDEDGTGYEEAAAAGQAGYFSNALPGNRSRGDDVGDVFETSLGFRMDVEACLAYLLLPPAGGAALLIFERKSDYVRFHAWQSSLVFTAAFVLHLLLTWSSFLSWLLFIADLALVGFLTFHAYQDAETLDRMELPFFGRLASRFVDSE